jgi:hypothetical protein
MAENFYAHKYRVKHLEDACNDIFDVMFLGFGGLCGGIISWYSKYWYLPSIQTFSILYGRSEGVLNSTKTPKTIG